MGPRAQVLLIAVFVLLAIAVGGALWLRHTYGTLDPTVPPPQVSAFGRDFRVGTLPDQSLAAVMATRTDGVGIDVLEPVIGAWPFVPFWVSSAVGPPFTPMVVWLHVGPDAYREYTIVGGP
jgi:hypothetical protein